MSIVAGATQMKYDMEKNHDVLLALLAAHPDATNSDRSSSCCPLRAKDNKLVFASRPCLQSFSARGACDTPAASFSAIRHPSPPVARHPSLQTCLVFCANDAPPLPTLTSLQDCAAENLPPPPLPLCDRGSLAEDRVAAEQMGGQVSSGVGSSSALQGGTAERGVSHLAASLHADTLGTSLASCAQHRCGNGARRWRIVCTGRSKVSSTAYWGASGGWRRASGLPPRVFAGVDGRAHVGMYTPNSADTVSSSLRELGSVFDGMSKAPREIDGTGDMEGELSRSCILPPLPSIGVGVFLLADVPATHSVGPSSVIPKRPSTDYVMQRNALVAVRTDDRAVLLLLYKVARDGKGITSRPLFSAGPQYRVSPLVPADAPPKIALVPFSDILWKTPRAHA
ncbi:hypothetical protein C8J57DRAFT_1509676 [Mycena rebaudengoi]|nr:hypothetical protein C8J57DRAFT_1509676 [Mycena rebaudengoi]